MYRRKDKRLDIRIDSKHRILLKNYCEKFEMSQSEFLRNAILYFSYEDRSEKLFTKDTKFKDELLYEINRYGNNLNQIAYNLNYLLKCKALPLIESEIISSITKLENIESQLSTIKETINKRL